VVERNLERYKELLLAKREELTSSRKGRDEFVPSGEQLHGDPADQASAASEASIQMRLQQTDSKLLRAIDEALGRVERRTYGICEVCGKHISVGRLTAVPWTRLCLDCKQGQNQ
jgi:RNA polymerase-binding transcription factor